MAGVEQTLTKLTSMFEQFSVNQNATNAKIDDQAKNFEQYTKAVDKSFGEIRSDMSAMKTNMSDMKNELDNLKAQVNSTKKSEESVWGNCDEEGDAKRRRLGRGSVSRSKTPTKNPMINQRALSRIIVDNFPGNTHRDKRVSTVKNVIDEGNMQTGFPGKIDVFCFEARGRSAIIQFETEAQMKQFYEDNLEAFKEIKFPINGGEPKKLFFNKSESASAKKKQNCTRHLLKYIQQGKCLGDVEVSVDKRAGQILVNEFPIITVSVNDELTTKYFVDRVNISDTSIEGLTASVEKVVADFSQTWN